MNLNYENIACHLKLNALSLILDSAYGTRISLDIPKTLNDVEAEILKSIESEKFHVVLQEDDYSIIFDCFTDSDFDIKKIASDHKSTPYNVLQIYKICLNALTKYFVFKKETWFDEVLEMLNNDTEVANEYLSFMLVEFSYNEIFDILKKHDLSIYKLFGLSLKSKKQVAEPHSFLEC